MEIVKDAIKYLIGKEPDTYVEESFTEASLDAALDEMLTTSDIPANGYQAHTARVSGRYYLYTDKRWVTSGDDNYGTAYFQLNEAGGTGATPTAEWEHRGLFVPAGTVLTEFYIVGRMSSTQVTDLEYYLVERKPTDPNAWESGYDNDNEMTNNLISNDKWFNHTDGAFTGATNDIHRRKITLATPHLFVDDAYLTMYVRPEGNLGGTRYGLMDIIYTLNA